MRRTLVLALLVLVVGLVTVAPAQASGGDRPSRVLIVVLDQMRPEYVDLFDMDNVRMLSEDGVDYADAYLGHMGSETVITHNVLTTGVLPKNMG
jgi:predicted AlkP superfamily pyrophosphatase or phosphodiesterase